MSERYTLRISRSASRAIAERLPEAAAAAVIEVITGPLLTSPRRLGHELHNELDGTWSARRGVFRILYVIDDERHIVRVTAVEHRRDAYRR